MAGKLTRREARLVARRYVVKLLRSQDMPDWPIDFGPIKDTDDASMTEFMDEVRRIADRLERTLPAGRTALEDKHG